MLHRGWWLYAGLGLIVLVLYTRLFIGTPVRLHSALEPEFETPAPSTKFQGLERDPTKLVSLFSQKPRVALLLGFWAVLLVGLVVSGVGLTVQLVRRRNLRRLFRYRSKLPRSWSLQELARMVLLLALVASLLPFVHLSLMAWGPSQLADPHLWSVLAMFIVHGFLVLTVCGFASARALSVRMALGLSRRRVAGAITQGLRGYVTLFPWIFGLLWILIQLCQRFGIQPPLEPIQELLFEERGIIVGLTVVLACLVGPVVEEIFFRGVLFPALRTRMSRVVAMLISGSMFAAVHTNPIGFLPIVILGCLLADLYERTGSLFSPIAVHMVHNALLVGLGLTFKALG